MPFTINANKDVLHYQWVDGKNEEAIVLINSLGTHLQIWSGVVAKLQRHFNVLLFDKRGHGLSSTREGEVRIDDYADDVVHLLDVLGIRKIHVVGLSIGGLITYSLASRYPDRVDRLIFSNTGAKIGTAESWNERIEKIKQDGLGAMAQPIVDRWLSSDFKKKCPEVYHGMITMLQRNADLGYIQACEAIREADYSPILNKINHPVLFMGGSEDIGATADFVQQQAANLNTDHVTIIDGAGHLPCIEKPEQVAELILAFCLGDKEISLYERGMKTRRSVLGSAHVDRAEANKTDFDRDFQEYIVHSAWGSIWSRPQLTKRERSLITIALLAALGHDEELEMHMKATRNTGASPEDVKEALLHTGVYAGVPVTNGAMKIAKRIFNNLKDNNNEQA